MSSEELVHHSKLNDGAPSPSSKAYNKESDGEQAGIRVLVKSEQPENPKEAKEWCDVVGRLQTPQQPQGESVEIDLQAMQEYVSRLPEALVPDFALLLAKRMKQQIRNSDKFSEVDAARVPAESLHGARTQTREPPTQITGRPGRSESTSAPRYIVTPHPSNPGRSIKQSVGEPELIPYLPPGVYRENREGAMELESYFRRSVVEQKQDSNEDGSVTAGPVEQGRLRKMMSKVFRRQT